MLTHFVAALLLSPALAPRSAATQSEDGSLATMMAERERGWRAGVSLRYRVRTSASPIETDPSASGSASTNAEWETVYSQHGAACYWAFRRLDVEPDLSHTTRRGACWFDGGAWHRLDPNGATGRIGSTPLEMTAITPDKYAYRVTDEWLSRIVARRPNHPDAAGDEQLRHLSVAIHGAAWNLVYDRHSGVRSFQGPMGDSVVSYDCTEYRVQDGVVLPARYSLSVRPASGRGWQREYHCELIEANLDPAVAAQHCATGFPTGTVVFDELSGEEFIYGEDSSAALAGWIELLGAGAESAWEAGYPRRTRARELPSKLAEAARGNCGEIAVRALATVVGAGGSSQVLLQPERSSWSLSELTTFARTRCGLDLIALQGSAGLPRWCERAIGLLAAEDGPVGHYVLLQQDRGGGVWIADFPFGTRRLRSQERLAAVLIPRAEIPAPRLWLAGLRREPLAWLTVGVAGVLLTRAARRHRSTAAPPATVAAPGLMLCLASLSSVGLLSLVACADSGPGGRPARGLASQGPRAAPVHSVDLGLVPLGSQPTIKAKIVNTAAVDMTIEAWSSSCTCTLPDVELPLDVPAGAEREIDVAWSLTAPGLRVGTLQALGTWGGRGPRVLLYELQFEARVPGHLTCDPPVLSLERSELPVSRSIVVRHLACEGEAPIQKLLLGRPIAGVGLSAAEPVHDPHTLRTEVSATVTISAEAGGVLFVPLRASSLAADEGSTISTDLAIRIL